MDPVYTQSLYQTLEQTIAPDTALIKKATVLLNTQFYTNKACIPSLFEIASSSTSTNPAIRQLALVELRKRVLAKKSKQWTTQPVHIRDGIKSNLLDLVVKEDNNQVRAAATRLISIIAQLEFEHNSWPDLLPWLWALTSSSLPNQREVALQALYMLLDVIATKQVLQLIQLLASKLNDPESFKVRIWTIRTLGKLSDFIELGENEEIQAFQSLIPGIVGVIQEALNQNDESAAKSGFEVIEVLTLSDTPLLTPHFTEIVQFLLSSAGNKETEPDLRIMALNALLWLVKMKKSKILSLSLPPLIISALLPIGAEPEAPDAEDDSPSRTSFRVLDILATSLPPASVFPPLFEQVRILSQSPDPMLRKSAITAFGVVVEGCSLFIQPHLESLWPLIFGGLEDTEVVVRKAACTALGCLCEMLEEECAKEHKRLLPLIFTLISNPDTQRSACVALDCLLEVLGNDIQPYIPSLMESLLQLLDSAPLTLKGTIVGAIGSAAHASKAKFAPYFAASMERIIPFLSLVTEGDEMDLRGVAQDTAGTLSEAVGKDLTRPYYPTLMKAALDAMSVPNAPQLKECSYIFFAVISRVFKDEFSEYLPIVMPLLLAAVQQGDEEVDEDGLVVSNNTADFGTGLDDDDAEGGEDDGFEDIDDDESLNSDTEDDFYRASTAMAIEKECAADALSELFSNVKGPFLVYVEPTVKSLIPGLKHWSEGIRKSSAATLLGFISTFYEMTEGEGAESKWKKGGEGSAPLQPNVQQLRDAVVPSIMEMWEEEDERDVVNELCSSFSAALMVVGPALIVPNYVEPICMHLDKILKRTAPCQVGDEEEEDAANNAADVSEYDAALIGAACDLVGTLSSTLGSDFAQIFPTFAGSMASYAEPERSVADRSTAIGSLAEIVNGLETAVTPFTADLYKIFLRSLGDSESEVQSNAAFAMGSLILHSQSDLSQQYLAVLGALHPLFVATGDSASKRESACDNAAGAVARMILKNPAALPLDQVLPVFLQALPLKRDFAESEKTFEAIFSLIHSQNPYIIENLDHLLKVFQHALASLSEGFYPNTDGAQITLETKNQLIELLKAINAQDPGKIAAAGLTPYLA